MLINNIDIRINLLYLYLLYFKRGMNYRYIYLW